MIPRCTIHYRDRDAGYELRQCDRPALHEVTSGRAGLDESDVPVCADHAVEYVAIGWEITGDYP